MITPRDETGLRAFARGTRGGRAGRGCADANRPRRDGACVGVSPRPYDIDMRSIQIQKDKTYPGVPQTAPQCVSAESGQLYASRRTMQDEPAAREEFFSLNSLSTIPGRSRR